MIAGTVFRIIGMQALGAEVEMTRVWEYLK